MSQPPGSPWPGPAPGYTHPIPVPPPPPPGYGTPPPGYGTPPPGYGTPLPAAGPGWQGLSPEQVTRLHRPGIIPLRPLTLSDIFGGAVLTMRRNPEATFGMAALVLGLFLLPSLGLSLLADTLTSMSSEDVSFLGLFLPVVLTGLATLALTGFIIHVVSEAALGEKVGLGQTWRAVRGRLPAVVGVSALATLVLIALTVVVVLLIVLGVELGGAVGVLLVIFTGLAAVLLLVWVGTRLSLATAPVVLERAGPIRGLRRSWALTGGRQFWRVLGIYLLAQIAAGLVAAAISTPLQLGVTLVIGVEPTSGWGWTVLLLSQHLVQFLTGLISVPFTAAVLALLYLDQRIRREGLDLAMQQAARTRLAARSGT